MFPVQPVFNVLGPQRQTPILTRLPQTQRSFMNKYNTIGPFLQQTYQPAITNSLMRLDQQRVNRGAQPLSKQQTISIAQAAATGRSQVPQKDTDIWDLFGNARDDLFAITSSIPKLPFMAVEEVQQLPQTVQRLPQMLGRGDISGVLQLPGIRMIPGAYTASNILSGNTQEAIEHPLFTALDVWPYVKKPLGSLVAKAAEAEAIQPALTNLRSTRPYQFLKGAFGSEAREQARLINSYSARIKDWADPFSPSEEAASRLDAINAKRVETWIKERPEVIPEDQLPEITRRVQLQPELIKEYPEPVQNWLGQGRQIIEDIGKYGVERGELARIGTEIYPLSQAKKIVRAQNTASVYKAIADVRNEVLNPTYEDPVAFARSAPERFMRGLEEEYVQEVHGIKRPVYSVKARKNIAEGYAHALAVTGYDASSLFDAIKATTKKADFDQLTRAFDEWEPVKIADPIESPQLAKRRNKYLARTSEYTDKAAAKFAKRAVTTETRNVPARFLPLQEELIQQRWKEHLDQNINEGLYAGDVDYAQLEQYVSDRMYDKLPEFSLDDRAASKQMFNRVMRGYRNEAAETVAEMRRAGFDPVYVHRVSPERAFQADHPTIELRYKSPSQSKEAIANGSATVGNIEVALRHQAMEWLRQNATVEFLDELNTRWGMDRAQVEGMFEDKARRLAASDPSLDYKGHLEQLIKKQYSKFEPDQWQNFPGSKVAFDPEQRWFPKYLVDNLKKWQEPGRLTGAWDPVLGAFRTSVLPLSPRWHIYNIIGGYMMLSAETNPLTAFRYMGDYLQIMRDIKAGIPVNIPDRMRVLLGTSSREARDYLMRSGGQLSRWWDDKVKVAGEGSTMGLLNKGREAGRNIIQKSFDLNAWFDDAYRVMAYLYAHDKAIAGKLTPREAAAAGEFAKAYKVTEAQAAGMNLARKVMQNWDELTPFERTVVRGIFPFYSFAQHILRYAMRYPFDHPVRASIVSSFARNELDDFGDLLPSRFLNVFFLGSPDQEGNITGINLAGMNPFADVANYFTLAGWVGSLNPVFSTALEQMGIDPRTAQSDLFPETTYDPVSGRLVRKSPNLATNFLFNTIPQTEAIATLLGAATDTRKLMDTDPAAAQRLLGSQFGIPVLWRDYNKTEEVAKAELPRMQAFTEMQRKALRTGDYSEASKYPVLRPLINQVRVLQRSGQLAPYEAGAGGGVLPYPTSMGI